MEERKIALWFSNNDFKYEAEATVRLFLKQKKFDFYFDTKPLQKNFILIRIKSGKIRNYFSVLYNIDGIKKIKGRIFLKKESSEKNICERILCRLLYDLLKEVTDHIPEWGIITGIRPVKKVNNLIAKNYSRDEIFRILKKEYDVSDKKADLAYKTAIVQKDFINKKNENNAALYISVPFCPSRCSYCSFVSQSIERAGNLIPEYLKKLCAELKILSVLIKDLDLSIDSIYIGGGTPTILTADQLDILMTEINNDFDLSYLREYSVEAGRPDTITYEKCMVIKKNGADRISINPQTMNDEVLEAIGRKHSSRQIIDAYEMARNLDFKCINMDLIAGLPGDTFSSFSSSVNKCIELEPDNITVHTLTLKRSSYLFNQWSDNIENPVKNMVDYSQKILPDSGYMPYYLYRQKNTIDDLENVGYTKKGKASIYNILIMEEIQTILGAGCGASSKIVEKNGKITRIHNYKFPNEYIHDFNKLMEKKKKIYEIIQIDKNTERIRRI